MRIAKISRYTKETDIQVSVSLDGTGRHKIKTPVGFLTHMLETLSKHSQVDLTLSAKGDTHIDIHHTNEDIAITVGQAFSKALGDKRGIERFGDMRIPLDEALTQTRATVDISARGSFHYHTRPKTRWIENPALASKANSKVYTVTDALHFFESFAVNSGITLHMEFISGENPHHLIEASFKSLARALRQAISISLRDTGIPSTKGKL